MAWEVCSSFVNIVTISKITNSCRILVLVGGLSLGTLIDDDVASHLLPEMGPNLSPGMAGM